MSRRVGPLLAAGAVAAVVALSVWARWPGFVQGGFANHDVAGILYNGMLLDHGLLPYVDSVEFKAPGTFYLAWWLADGGLDIDRFQIWANLWALCSLLAVAAFAWRLWGPLSAVVAACVYALHDANLDTMDANYVTWSQLPSIIAVGWAMEATRHRSPRARLIAFAVAGAAAATAVLLKRPAGVVLVLVVAMAAWSRNWRPPVAVVVGAAVVFGAVALHYAAHGELGGLWDGYVLNRWGWEYAASGTALNASEAPKEGLFATLYFLPLPLALAAFAAWSPAESRTQTRWLLLWVLGSLVAAGVGFRFYKGYYLAVLPPLALLAAAPWGLLGRASRIRPLARIIALLPALLLVGRQWIVLEGERKNRAFPHDRGGKIVAQHVAKKTGEDDRIWIWGWHLWDVYPYANRLAGTRFYKTMELTTSPNDATWRRQRTPLKFVNGPAADALLSELEANLPAYIVIGSAVPIRDFADLRAFLRSYYKRDRSLRLNRVQFWKRAEGHGG